MTLTTGDRVIIRKGCRARQIPKGLTAVVGTIEALGADYSHCVRVVLTFQNGFIAGKSYTFFARHVNRLDDDVIGLNDGRPEHRIEIQRKHAK